MKKIKFLFLIMLATFMSVTSVNAELLYENQSFGLFGRRFSEFPFDNYFDPDETTSYSNNNFFEIPSSSTSNFTLPKYIYAISCSTGQLELTTSTGSKGLMADYSQVIGGHCTVNGYDGFYYLDRWTVDQWNYYTNDNGGTVYGIKWNITVHNPLSYTIFIRYDSVFASNDLITDFSNEHLLLNLINQNSNLRSELNEVKSNTSETNNKLDETNQELGDLNNSMTSESNDFDDSSCGVICKLGKIPGKIIDGLIEGIKSLFIPEDGYFENWFNNLKSFFEEKLGFLAAPFTIFIDFVNMYLNLDANTDIIINIPDIYVPNFEEYKIISATSFNWSDLLKSKESLNTLWQLYLAFVDVFLILNFINLCESKYNAIFGGNTSNYEYYTVEDSITYDNDTGEVTGRRMNERRTTRKKV